MNVWVDEEPPHGSQLARPRNQTSMADEYGMPDLLKAVERAVHNRVCNVLGIDFDWPLVAVSV